MLISHIDHEVLIDNRPGPRVIQVRDWLLGAGLLRTLPAGSKHPKTTVLTDDGRMTVAFVLAGYADALVAAGLLESPETGERPIEVLKRLKAKRQDPLAAALQAAENLAARIPK